MAEEKTLITDAKEKLSDILTEVSWREIAHSYFGKSSSWLYHKLNGVKSDGTEGGGFSPAESAQLKEALLDLSARISTAAQSL